MRRAVSGASRADSGRPSRSKTVNTHGCAADLGLASGSANSVIDYRFDRLSSLDGVNTSPSRDVNYVHVCEEMLGGESMLRPVIWRPSDPERRQICVKTSEGDRFMHFSLFSVEDRVVRWRLGNYSNGLVRTFQEIILPNDEVGFALRAKCLNGIIQKISRDSRVAARWLPSDSAVVIRNLEEMLGQPDERIAERSNGVYLRNTRVDINTAGDWFLACLIERMNRKGTSINARLMLELLCALTTTEDETVFRDILVHAEQWLVGEGCDSCLRNVLRAVDNIAGRTLYPYSYWEFDHNARSISVSGAAYLWSVEPHGTGMTIGKVIEKLGDHDFIVLNCTEKNVIIRVTDPEMREDFVIPTIYFASLKTVIF